MLFREITCGSNLWRVLCSCISVFLTNIFLSVTGKWPLVYAYMNLQTCIGVLSTHLGMPSCLNKHEVSALYGTLHTLRTHFFWIIIIL